MCTASSPKPRRQEPRFNCVGALFKSGRPSLGAQREKNLLHTLGALGAQLSPFSTEGFWDSSLRQASISASAVGLSLLVGDSCVA